MTDLMIGTSAFPTADLQRLEEASIAWVRQDFPFPFIDCLGGDITSRYQEAREAARAWANKGMHVMGVSPLPGIGTCQADRTGQMRLTWKDFLPDWLGVPGSVDFIQNYRQVCEWLAVDLQGIVQAWQIANELDIPQFAGPLNLKQASDLVLETACGLKLVNPSLIVGTNTGGSSRSFFFYGRLFADTSAPLDYCGVDQYYGSWQAGSPADWDARIDELYAVTGKPVLVNEWGFSSAGETMAPDELLQSLQGAPSCQFRKWRFSWGEGHTRASQAEYVRQAMRIFYKRRAKLAGMFFYRWEDQEVCWQCGSPECPIETAWGLVDREGRPKEAFEAFCEGSKRIKGNDAGLI
jgi:hypothetical protein